MEKLEETFEPDIRQEALKNGFVSIRFPKKDADFHAKLEKLLVKAGIDATRCDTSPGYWNLNADWVEFEIPVYTSWGLCWMQGKNFLIRWLNWRLANEGAIAQFFYVDIDKEGKKSLRKHY